MLWKHVKEFCLLQLAEETKKKKKDKRQNHSRLGDINLVQDFYCWSLNGPQSITNVFKLHQHKKISILYYLQWVLSLYLNVLSSHSLVCSVTTASASWASTQPSGSSLTSEPFWLGEFHLHVWVCEEFTWLFSSPALSMCTSEWCNARLEIWDDLGCHWVQHVAS